MPKKKLSIIYSLILTLLIFNGFFLYKTLRLEAEPNRLNDNQSEINPEKPVILTIAFTEAQNEECLFSDASQSQTAFDFLNRCVDEKELNFETQDYGDMGILVKTIGDKTGGDGGKYWQYLVNGVYGEVAASQKIVSSGDRIEWFFK